MRAADNPFNSRKIENLSYRHGKLDIEGLCSKLKALNYRGAILGMEGSGKTTLLIELEKYLNKRGMKTKRVFINDTNRFTAVRERRLISDSRGRVVFMDGADMLGPIIWAKVRRRILRSAAGLVITSHTKKLLPVLTECSSSYEVFSNIVRGLLEGDKEIEKTFLEEIYRRHTGNIRDCLRQLYDVYADSNRS